MKAPGGGEYTGELTSQLGGEVSDATHHLAGGDFRVRCCSADNLSRPFLLWWLWLAVAVLAFLCGLLVGSGSSATAAAANTATAVSDPRAALPAPDAVLTRIAFGSCSNQNFSQPYWDTLYTLNPDITLLGGDNVYGDCLGKYSRTPAADCSELTEAYRVQKAHPSWMGARRRLPMLATWDDHDYGLDDGDASFAYKDEAKERFLEFVEAAADDERRTHDGVYSSHIYGPAGRRTQIILLDLRYFRSVFKSSAQYGFNGKYLPDADASKTMLGAEQWAWLRRELSQPAELRLIVSSIQVVLAAHGWERWGNLPTELQTLFDLIRTTRAKGVVFLSGDRHIGGAFAYDGAKSNTRGREFGPHILPYPKMWEVTSSSWTHAITEPFSLLEPTATSNETDADELEPTLVGPVVRTNNIGIVDVDWSAGTLELSLRRAERTPVSHQSFQNNAGEVVSKVVLRLQDLRGPVAAPL